MNSQMFWVTNYGEVPLPEGGCPMKKYRAIRYNEYTGEPYEVSYEYPDFESQLGQEWAKYAAHLQELARAVWEANGDVFKMKVPSFSEWRKRED